MAKTPTSPTDEAGFTVVEALCALAILALALIAGFQALQGAQGNAARLAEFRTERSLAAEVLTELHAAPRDRMPQWHGADGAIAWRMNATPQAGTSDGWRLYRLDLDIRGARSGLRISTLRLLRTR